ncbi:hypothetical protein BX616_011293 [Lobosporangium transversale]|uniref:Uncharacterized protein n=1 Tax=Lobosporangium transversale TaxID=64571 RepID=A0A1Y2G975_9FUNG|nr:hypothetical protein BCR41DRAFT_195638 [Lobosporangium transversale]KAF9909096.1 hypothetical protein BX616_011293 [Lobosporangium transversale]ORZ04572.1 hypothetical protein BCR41DRAFT_195638 [Lobosporangium transversale]|eukprot:XP_021876618.1 hypothetical protein BCR41DRAFT_195638 [Lobosporangium transversale]
MPPLQCSSTFDLAAPIPFADHSSSFDTLFNADPFTTNSVQQHPSHYQYTDIEYLPSEADINALFGLPPSHSSAQNTQKQIAYTTSTTASISPPTHYTSLTEQDVNLSSSVPVAPACDQRPSPVSLSARSSLAPNKCQQSAMSKESFRTQDAHNAGFQYQLQTSQDYQQQQQQQQQYTPCQHYSSDRYNATSYSTASIPNMGPYGDMQHGSSTVPTSTNPLVLNPPSSSFFARLGARDGASPLYSTGNQSTFTPKLAKAAASCVSNTLAVTSTFASKKLANASHKIADLWQHNQNVLPQQQPNSYQQQQHAPDSLYNHGNYYTTEDATNSTKNSGPNGSCFNNNNYLNNVNASTYSYDRVALNINHNSNNVHQQSSQGENAYGDHDTSNPFAASTTSTLSNAVSVASSYLPSLSKLPTLSALPALPWSNRSKDQQLPHQQTYQQGYSSDNYYSSYDDSRSQETQAYSSQGHQQEQQRPYLDQHVEPNNHCSSTSSILASTGALWGGLRSEMQKGRQMVETGVQAGVAWWWDHDVKNPLRNVV